MNWYINNNVEPHKIILLIPTQSDFSADIWPMVEPDPPVVLLVSRSLPPAPGEYDRYLNVTENAGRWGEWAFCPANSACSGK